MQKQSIAKKKKKEESKLKSDLLTVLKNLIAQSAIFIVACLIALAFDLKADMYFPLALSAFGAGSFVSGFLTGRIKRKNGLLYGMLYSLPVIIIFIIISVCLNGMKLDYSFIISVLLMLILSAVGGVVSVNIRKSVKIKK